MLKVKYYFEKAPKKVLNGFLICDKYLTYCIELFQFLANNQKLIFKVKVQE